MHNLYIKHKQYRDVCWRVLAQYGGTGYIKYKAECWNLGFDKSWPLNVKDYIDISYDDMSNWLYTTDMVPCLRNANWQELSNETKS